MRQNPREWINAQIERLEAEEAESLTLKAAEEAERLAKEAREL